MSYTISRDTFTDLLKNIDSENSRKEQQDMDDAIRKVIAGGCIGMKTENEMIKAILNEKYKLEAIQVGRSNRKQALCDYLNSDSIKLFEYQKELIQDIAKLHAKPIPAKYAPRKETQEARIERMIKTQTGANYFTAYCPLFIKRRERKRHDDYLSSFFALPNALMTTASTRHTFR